MITFEEWLVENHSEVIEEINRFGGAAGWAGMGALALSSLFPQAAQAAPPVAPQNQAAATATQSQNQQARLDAMKRVSAVHKFKKNWGSEFGPKEDQKLFDAILKLQTEKDHDDFLNLVEKNRADNLKIQMTGSYHPDKFSKQLKTKEIYNSYDFQYSDYMRTLATASKMNL
jgi:C-terminal processing protease CtpA/Prc